MNRSISNLALEPSEPPAPRPRERVQTFRALRHRDFRLLWVSLIVSGIGTWMQIVAQSLLVLKITHGSALALGIVSLAQALSFFLFALIGGSVADRIDKRRFLLVTQSLSMLLAFLLGVLTYTNVIQVWIATEYRFPSLDSLIVYPAQGEWPFRSNVVVTVPEVLAKVDNDCVSSQPWLNIENAFLSWVYYW